MTAGAAPCKAKEAKQVECVCSYNRSEKKNLQDIKVFGDAKKVVNFIIDNPNLPWQLNKSLIRTLENLLPRSTSLVLIGKL